MRHDGTDSQEDLTSRQSRFLPDRCTVLPVKHFQLETLTWISANAQNKFEPI